MPTLADRDQKRRDHRHSGGSVHRGGVSRRDFLIGVGAVTVGGLIFPSCKSGAITLENQFVKYVIGRDGANLSFAGKQTGIDYLAGRQPSRCAQMKKDGRTYDASGVSFSDGRLRIDFGAAGMSAVIRVETRSHYFVFEVESLAGDPDELVFINIPTALEVKADEPFSAGTLALNLQTNVEELPGPQAHLWAAGYQALRRSRRPGGPRRLPLCRDAPGAQGHGRRCARRAALAARRPVGHGQRPAGRELSFRPARPKTRSIPGSSSAGPSISPRSISTEP